MKIEFTGNWPEIRTEIQKFSIDHLNMKLGISTTAPAERERHEDMGGPINGNGSDHVDKPRKVKKAKPETFVAPEPLASSPVSENTQADCVSALEKVYNTFGMEKSIELLSRFGVKRARELKPNQFKPFIDLCGQTAG